jgi:hypothetical protein
MCRYKITEKQALKDQLSDFMYLYFHFYGHYIKVYIFFNKSPYVLALFSKNSPLSPLTFISIQTT